jgi:hypothetical protein
VTVAEPPAATEAGLMPSETSVTAAVLAVGVTVTEADWLAPPFPAVRLIGVEVVTAPAVTGKLAVDWPLGTV